jgi:hypothetical protein
MECENERRDKRDKVVSVHRRKVCLLLKDAKGQEAVQECLHQFWFEN